MDMHRLNLSYTSRTVPHKSLKKKEKEERRRKSIEKTEEKDAEGSIEHKNRVTSVSRMELGK